VWYSDSMLEYLADGWAKLSADLDLVGCLIRWMSLSWFDKNAQ
jgi:hypothetical protein